ncbi:MAG: lysylphosphatidylglycerol synthase transmembrane domain-containing protein, partial [Candidatus Aenigmatarchaeota archaeon]
MKKRFYFLTISFILLGALIYFSDVGNLLEVLGKSNIYLIIIGIGVWTLGNIIRSLRWKYLLSKVGMDISLKDTIPIFTAGLFLSNISPAKSGDPIRSLLLKRNKGYSFSKSLPSIFIERIMDLTTIILISIIGVAILTARLGQISFWLNIAVTVWIGLISLGIYIGISKRRTKKFLSKIQSIFSFIPKIDEMKDEMEKLSENIHKSFMTYKNKKTLFTVFLLTVTAWFLEGIIIIVAFYSLGLEITYVSAVSAVAIGILIGIFTILPGALGSYEIISVTFFMAIYSYSTAE